MLMHAHISLVESGGHGLLNDLARRAGSNVPALTSSKTVDETFGLTVSYIAGRLPKCNVGPRQWH